MVLGAMGPVSLYTDHGRPLLPSSYVLAHGKNNHYHHHHLHHHSEPFSALQWHPPI